MIDHKEFAEWHESVLLRNNYPPKIVEELRAARTKWLSGCR